MKIKTETMLAALNAVKPGVATKTIIQQMENVLFAGQDIITYNSQICICYPFETDFTASINYKDLLKVVSKIDADEFEMTLVENEVRIKAPGTKAGLILTMEDDIGKDLDGLIAQLPSEENKIAWNKLPDEFMKAALLCIPAASTDMSQGTLTCLYANQTDLICSDNLRVSWYNLAESLNAEFFVKATVIKELAQFDFKEFSVSDSWINFRADNNAVFSTRLIRGKSLDYFKVVFDGFTGKPITLPEHLGKAIDAASVMAQEDDDRGVWISFKNGKIVCGTQSSRGWIEKELAAEYESEEPLEFMVSAAALQQILSMPLITLVGDKKSYFESGRFKHVLLHRMGA